MLVSLKHVLDMAQKGNFCIPAFNVYNMETVMGVIKAAEEEKAPVIIQVYPRLINEEVGYYLAPVILAAAKKATVPVCFHLDHGPSELEAQKILYWGATGIMYDGSVLPFEENAAMTVAVTEFAHARGITVEAELGHVCDAIAGTGEDALLGNTEAKEENPEDSLTDPKEVEKFIEITDVDALAVAVGTAHGVYRSTPTLRLDRLDEINKISKSPLVLHGGSGTPDDQVKKAIELGITKINIYSEVLNGLNTGLKDKLNDIQNMSMWPIYVYENANERMREVIRNKIRTFGSNGRV